MSFGFSAHPQRRVFAAFFVYSLALGGIFPRLGDIQLAMGIKEGALGAALMGTALGTQVSLMFAGPLIERLGHRKLLLTAIPLLGLIMAIGSQASGPFMLFLALAAAGVVVGAIEIVINVEADRTEHLLGRRVMNRAHAFWSFGFFSAGLVGAAAKQLGLSPLVHLFGMAAIILVATLWVLKDFAPAPARVAEEGLRPRFVRPSWGILVLVGFTLSAMLLEGAGIDWSVIYMRDTFDVAPFINSIAFVAGALAQALARYFADRFVDRFGPVNVARFMIATLGVGAVLVSFAIHPAIALCGFTMMGLGTSGIFPLAMSAAAQRTDRPATTNVAALAQLSFITFLLAPPVLGFVAEHFGIRYSFGIGIPLVILSWFTIHTIAPAPSAKAAAAGANA